ncbi:hypothetical protein HYH03_010326 [Edaphochlamys debaryana]|uniref:Carbohydrate kinase PfkB domain-containing protein n=1 Tax=Edaphochlamys debaryana TaxID=47281 RepID=A0A836BWC2_9CHLO|nr:hypothetical protein HYH03_010326 [Edaphochlamys debaryana]|eukprot:KAG2491320.1 hypothetical protein HYH03_010326 [Edaphochlamys debaryana]
MDVQRGTSVPGQVRQVPGGVGRNMAEALARLLPPERPAPVFVSLLGDDTAGRTLAAALRRIRLDLTHLLTVPGAPTPCVSAVMDRGGEVAACVADVSSVEEHLTPERLEAECGRQLQQACMVLAEANLSAPALAFVAARAAAARVPVFLEPVLAPALPHASFVSPNAGELMALADQVCRAAGLPLLPRPLLPDDEGAAGAGARQGQQEGEAGPGAAGGAGSPGSTPGSGPGGDGTGAGLGAGGSSTGGAAGASPGGAAGAATGGGEPVVELLRQLAAFAEVVLAQGTGCVVLTLGSLGAALITLCEPAAAAAALAAAQPPPLAPLDAAAASPAATAASLCPAAASAASTRPPTHFFAAARCSGLEGGDGKRAACGGAGPQVTPGAPLGRGAAGCGAQAAGARLSAGARWPAGLQPAVCSAAGDGEAGLGAGAGLGAVAGGGGRWLAVEHMRALPAEVVSVNGAGDTLVAAMVAALVQGMQPVHALAYGMAAARAAVQSPANVPLLDWAALRPDAEAVLGTLQRHVFPGRGAA